MTRGLFGLLVALLLLACGGAEFTSALDNAPGALETDAGSSLDVLAPERRDASPAAADVSPDVPELDAGGPKAPDRADVTPREASPPVEATTAAVDASAADVAPEPLDAWEAAAPLEAAPGCDPSTCPVCHLPQGAACCNASLATGCGCSSPPGTGGWLCQ